MADAQVVATPAGDGDAANGTSEAVGQTGNGQGQGPNLVEAVQQQRPGFWQIIKTLAIRMFIIYMISMAFRRNTPQQPTTGKDGQVVPAATPSSNVFPRDLLMDMYVYISEDAEFSDFNNKAALFWLEEELMYGDWVSGLEKDGSYTKAGQIPISQSVQNNGSLYIHVYFVKSGNSPDPSEKNSYNRRMTLHKSRMLNKFKKRKFHTTVNLLTGKTDAHPDLVRLPNDTAVEILSHWHPNLTLNVIDDHTPWVKGSVPSPLDEYIDFLPGTNNYYPILYFNDYWNMNTDYNPINETTPLLNLSLTYSPMSLFKWQMYAAQSMRSRWYSFLGDDFMEESDEDQDSLKHTFLDTNPYLLGLTIVVSIIHSVFEFLAFKNDIQFWRNRKSLEGLSVRSVFFNVFQSLIVVLYVLDNETNFVVRVSVFIGLLIEIWKIFKVINVELDRENPIAGLIPRIKFQDKSTYSESSTKQYDMLAFKYLSWLMFPLLGGYGVYSVLYLEHKGWYSWVLNILYGFLLTFGFIMMTPQLFINYKLKSVAHLPWRMLTYKSLNTFIDDLFAFVIKMPTLYRLGCFRDDIVFCIYLYQRYIYRVDPKRVNEFGTSGDMFDQNGDVITADDSQAIEANEATPNETTPNETTPNETTPNETTPNETQQDKKEGKKGNKKQTPPKPKNKKQKKDD